MGNLKVNKEEALKAVDEYFDEFTVRFRPDDGEFPFFGEEGKEAEAGRKEFKKWAAQSVSNLASEIYAEGFEAAWDFEIAGKDVPKWAEVGEETKLRVLARVSVIYLYLAIRQGPVECPRISDVTKMVAYELTS